MPSAQVTITQLPAAGAITGTEAVPIVQNGQTVQTTTGAIAASPSQQQTFITVTNQPTLPNSRSLSGGTGIGLIDGGAQSTLQITLNGASGALESLGSGFVVKDGSTVVNRTLTTSANGISITNGNGTAGNPQFSLSSTVGTINGLVGTGIMGVVSGSSTTLMTIQGTANQIIVADGGGPNDPTIAIAPNPGIPGTGAMRIPIGSSGQRPPGLNGQIRYNTTTDKYEAYQAGSWVEMSTSAGVLGFFYNGSLVGIENNINFVPGTGITTTVTDDPGNARVDVTNELTPSGVTLGSYGAANKTLTLTVDTYGRITAINDPAIAIANTQVSGLGTMSVQNANSVAITGGSINGTTIGNSSAAAITGTTITANTQFTGSGAGLNNIPNAALQNSSITIGTTGISLGATASTLAGLTSVTVTQAPTSALQLATKQYVDDQVAAGITIHAPVRVETPTALNATYTPGGTAVTVTDITGSKTLTFSSSPSLSVNDQIVFSVTSNGITSGTAYYVYSAPAANQVTLSLSYNGPELTTLTNGTGLTITGTVNAGVGATLTNAGANAAIQIDGVNLSATNRVLVYNQANAFENGVYTVTTVGTPDPGGTPWVLTRATTENTYKPDSISGLGQGDYFFVQEGNTGAGESYVLTTTNPLIIGTTNLTFTQFSASQVYSAGTGLTLSGTTFSLTSPVVTTLGGTGLTSYTTGDIVYYAAGTALSKLGIGTSTHILTSSGSAPQWTDPTTITVGTATNANNVAVAASSVNATFYPTFVDATTGNQAVEVDSDLTYNPSTNTLTAGTMVATTGIFGGTF